MTLYPKLLSGKQGEIAAQVDAGVVHQWWSRGRIPWGEEVTLGAVMSGWPDGTAVKFVIMERDEAGEDDFVEEVDATIDKCLAHTSYKIEFEDPDSDEGSEYEFYFLVEVDDEAVSTREESPILFVDLTLPLFSE